MENNKANKQTDDIMTPLQMECEVERAISMVSFIASTLLMAGDAPSEIDVNWFGELSFYTSEVADVLVSVRDSLAATRTEND